MPGIPKTQHPLDPANTASKLPDKLRKPGGMALQVLADLMGADDPMSGIYPSVPLVSVFKNAAGVPDKLLRQRGTMDFLRSAKDTAIEGIDTAAELFAEKYPRVAAHMRLRPDESMAMPGMAETKSPYGRVTEPIDVALAKDQPYPLNLLTHEGTHVAQSLGNKNALKLYDLANEHKNIGYPRNPFEKTANWAGQQAEALPRYMDPPYQRPPNAIKALKSLAQSDPNRGPVKVTSGTRNTSQEILDVLSGQGAGVTAEPAGMAAEGLRLIKGNAATPVAEMLGAEWSRPSADRGARLLEAFRPKDLSQVMPSMPSQVPAAPRAAEQVGEAFRAFRGSGGLPEHVPQAPAHVGERAGNVIEDYKGVIAALLRGKL